MNGDWHIGGDDNPDAHNHGALLHNLESTDNLRVIVLLIGGERYVFIFSAGQELEVLHLMAKYAWERKDLNFTGAMVREMADRFRKEGVI